MTKEDFKKREEQAAMIESKFRRFATWAIVSRYYKDGIWKTSEDVEHRIVYTFINYERNEKYNYVPVSFDESEAGIIYLKTINKCFKEKHIASYKVHLPYLDKCSVTIYAQTRWLAIKAIEAEKPWTHKARNKGAFESFPENALEVFRKYECKYYRAGENFFTERATQNIGDKFSSVSSEEKQLLNKIYLDLIKSIAIENDILEGNTDKFKENGKPILDLWRWWYCTEDIEYRKCVEKYFDRLFDRAAKEVADIWKVYLANSKYKDNGICFSELRKESLTEPMNEVNSTPQQVFEEEDYYDEDIEEHGITLDAYAFYDEWYDVHRVAPTYDDVLEYCEKPNMIEGIYDGIKRYDTSYKNEEDFAKLLWAAVQKLLS